MWNNRYKSGDYGGTRSRVVCSDSVGAAGAFTVINGDLDADTIALLVAHPLGGGGGVLMILNNCGVIIIGLWSDSPPALDKV